MAPHAAKDLQKKLALAEAEKAAESARRAATEEAEKKTLLEHLSKPSGVSDEVRMQRAVVGEQAVGKFADETLGLAVVHGALDDGGRKCARL